MRMGWRRTVAVAGLLAMAAVSAGCSSDSSDDESEPDVAVDGGSSTSGASEKDGGSTVPTDAAETSMALPAAIAGFSSATYADPVNWVCRADVDDDACDLDLSTTVVDADSASSAPPLTATSTTNRVEPPSAGDDAVDCFYVYPTVNFDGVRDDAMSADMTAEIGVVEAQLAQFGQVCRLWAPLYRQVTLNGFGDEANREVAYGDVRDAFFHWLANDSDGRPFVLIGHSQGTGHLATLLSDEVADEPLLTDRLVSALLLGGRTEVLGGDRSTTSTGLPLCATSQDTGCVIAFNTVSPVAAEADLARWGGASEANQRACTNPADPAMPADAWAPVDSIVPVSPDDPVFADVATPFLRLDGAIEVRCTVRGAASVLEARPVSSWSGRDLTRLTTDVPGWGLHIIEVNIVEGSLVALVEQQITAFGV